MELENGRFAVNYGRNKVVNFLGRLANIFK